VCYFPQWLQRYTFLAKCTRFPVAPYSHQHLGFFCCCLSNSHSIVWNDVSLWFWLSFFLYLLMIYVFFRGMYIQILWPFWRLNCRHSLHNLDTPYQIHNLQITSSLLCRCLCILFRSTKLSLLISSQLGLYWLSKYWGITDHLEIDHII
jgi:hypothetical protein